MRVHHDCQQNSDEWIKARLGIPTASEFSRVVTSKGEPSKQASAYAAILAAESIAKQPLDKWEGNKWTERGHDLEDEARAAYAFRYRCKPEIVGFFTNEVIHTPRLERAGASPDALIDDVGGLEMKCLSPQQHVITLDYLYRHKRCPPDFYAQCQGQILVCELEWVDLWFYHPTLRSAVFRVHRDDTFQRALQLQLSALVQERDYFLEVLAA